MKRFKLFKVLAFVFAILIAAAVFTLLQIINKGVHSAGSYIIDIVFSSFIGAVSFGLLMLILYRGK